MVSGRDRTTMDALNLILKKLHWAGKDGVGVQSIVCEEPAEVVGHVLKLLEDSRFVVSQEVSGVRRYYHIKYY